MSKKELSLALETSVGMVSSVVGVSQGMVEGLHGMGIVMWGTPK